jgi:hypothetical protein
VALPLRKQARPSFDLDQGRPAFCPSKYITAAGIREEPIMPADAAIVVSGVTVVFVLFALVLAWGNHVSG